MPTRHDVEIFKAYDLSNGDILDRFMQACAKAGVSSSGLVIDFMGSTYNDLMRYYRGVLLVRLEKISPPFSVGEAVSLKDKKIPWSIDWRTSRQITDYKQKAFVVCRVTYRGESLWSLQFDGVNEPYDDGERYTPNGGPPLEWPAEYFSKVSKEENDVRKNA